MSRAARLAAEALAREVRDLMDMGVPRNLPFDQWLADYFMRFAASPEVRAMVTDALPLRAPGETTP